MKKKDVFKYFRNTYKGGIYKNKSGALATEAATGITHQAIYKWGAVVPDRSQMLIELVTEGELKRDKA